MDDIVRLSLEVFEDFGYKIINKVEKYYDNPMETAYKYSLEM